jgi:hypothetical protein
VRAQHHQQHNPSSRRKSNVSQPGGVDRAAGTDL